MAGWCCDERLGGVNLLGDVVAIDMSIRRTFLGPFETPVRLRVRRCLLAEPAWTDCRGAGGSVLDLLHSRGQRLRLLRRGHCTGQFLTADPDGGNRNDQ